MTIHTTQTSPQDYARIGGALYLIIIALGVLGGIVTSSLIASGDAAATANNIIASEWLWRLGILSGLIMHVCDVGVMLAFYVLLRPVSKNLALLALLLNLVQTAVLVAFKLNLLVVVFLLGNANYLQAFEPQQLQVLSYIFIRADAYGSGIGLIFFGFTVLVLGYLIFRSGYLPRILGVLMVITGVCYLTNSIALLLDPAFADRLSPFILLPAFIGELSVSLWLLVKGVNVPKWQTRALESA
jgi:hypothetical protein